MKHAALTYTCIGLMGAAALTGFIDYSKASRSGLMDNLYKEETPAVGFVSKDITLEDYSRGPIEEYAPMEEIISVKANDPKKKKKGKKFIPPPPPAPDAPPPPDIKEGDIQPPPPPKQETPTIPAIQPAPPAEAVKEIPAVPVIEPAPVVEVKEVSFESFSRAPLKKKKITPVTKHKQ